MPRARNKRIKRPKHFYKKVRELVKLLRATFLFGGIGLFLFIFSPQRWFPEAWRTWLDNTYSWHLLKTWWWWLVDDHDLGSKFTEYKLYYVYESYNIALLDDGVRWAIPLELVFLLLWFSILFNVSSYGILIGDNLRTPEQAARKESRLPPRWRRLFRYAFANIFLFVFLALYYRVLRGFYLFIRLLGLVVDPIRSYHYAYNLHIVRILEYPVWILKPFSVYVNLSSFWVVVSVACLLWILYGLAMCLRHRYPCKLIFFHLLLWFVLNWYVQMWFVASFHVYWFYYVSYWVDLDTWLFIWDFYYEQVGGPWTRRESYM